MPPARKAAVSKQAALAAEMAAKKTGAPPEEGRPTCQEVGSGDGCAAGHYNAQADRSRVGGRP